MYWKAFETLVDAYHLRDAGNWNRAQLSAFGIPEDVLLANTDQVSGTIISRRFHTQNRRHQLKAKSAKDSAKEVVIRIFVAIFDACKRAHDSTAPLEHDPDAEVCPCFSCLLRMGEDVERTAPLARISCLGKQSLVDFSIYLYTVQLALSLAGSGLPAFHEYAPPAEMFIVPKSQENIPITAWSHLQVSRALWALVRLRMFKGVFTGNEAPLRQYIRNIESRIAVLTCLEIDSVTENQRNSSVQKGWFVSAKSSAVIGSSALSMGERDDLDAINRLVAAAIRVARTKALEDIAMDEAEFAEPGVDGPKTDTVVVTPEEKASRLKRSFAEAMEDEEPDAAEGQPGSEETEENHYVCTTTAFVYEMTLLVDYIGSWVVPEAMFTQYTVPESLKTYLYGEVVKTVILAEQERICSRAKTQFLSWMVTPPEKELYRYEFSNVLAPTPMDILLFSRDELENIHDFPTTHEDLVRPGAPYYKWTIAFCVIYWIQQHAPRIDINETIFLWDAELVARDLNRPTLHHPVISLCGEHWVVVTGWGSGRDALKGEWVEGDFLDAFLLWAKFMGKKKSVVNRTTHEEFDPRDTSIEPFIGDSNGVQID